MRFILHSVLVAGLTTVVAACSDVASPRDAAAGVTGEIRGDALVVRNPLDAPICYFPIEQQYAAGAQLVLSVDATSCSTVDARSTWSIPLADISGWNAEAHNVILYWWIFAGSRKGAAFENSIHALVAGR